MGHPYPLREMARVPDVVEAARRLGTAGMPAPATERVSPQGGRR